MHVRWDTTTTHFLVTNGIKQGGILWPMQFNVYMDDLSIKLIQSSIGGNIGGHLINHLCCSDDKLSDQKFIIIYINVYFRH